MGNAPNGAPVIAASRPAAYASSGVIFTTDRSGEPGCNRLGLNRMLGLDVDLQVYSFATIQSNNIVFVTCRRVSVTIVGGKFCKMEDMKGMVRFSI